MENWSDKNNLNENEFLTFLNKLRSAGILDRRRERQIIFADDQYINLQALKMSAESIDPSFNQWLKMFQNGQETLEYVEKLLGEIGELT